MDDNVNEADKRVELFGVLELVLSEKKVGGYGYKDVFYLKNRKKNPYQGGQYLVARAQGPAHQPRCVRSAQEAAIAWSYTPRCVRHKRQPSCGPVQALPTRFCAIIPFCATARTIIVTKHVHTSETLSTVSTHH